MNELPLYEVIECEVIEINYGSYLILTVMGSLGLTMLAVIFWLE